jgi:uncharacterized membrane protein YkvA (DUF1232 family)
VVPIAYHASPIQVVPNFIPVLGHLDDVIVLGVCLRLATRCVSPRLLAKP